MCPNCVGFVSDLSGTFLECEVPRLGLLVRNQSGQSGTSLLRIVLSVGISPEPVRTVGNQSEQMSGQKLHMGAPVGHLMCSPEVCRLTQEPGSRILNPGSRILDPGSGIHDPGSWIQGPGSRILEPGSWIQDPGSWILDSGSWSQISSLPRPPFVFLTFS